MRILEEKGLVKFHILETERWAQNNIKYLEHADIIVLQRLAHPRWMSLLSFARSKKKCVIFELDDNLLEIPPGYPGHGFLKRIFKKVMLRSYIKKADGVIVSTEKLKDYLLNCSENVHVLGNYMDRDVCGLEPALRGKKEVVTIGYAGTPSHGTDLKIVIPAASKIMDEFKDKVRFLFVGHMPSVFRSSRSVEFVEYVADYGSFLQCLHSSGMDFALAPLADNLFNRCKSSIKFLEYSLCGIPGIYSNIPPYSDVVRESETGLLVRADSTQYWYVAMKRFILDAVFRENVGKNCYNYVKENFLLQYHYMKWHETYRLIFEKKQKGIP